MQVKVTLPVSALDDTVPQISSLTRALFSSGDGVALWFTNERDCILRSGMGSKAIWEEISFEGYVKVKLGFPHDAGLNNDDRRQAIHPSQKHKL